jgi:SAM-dependent methyltransferase
MKLSDIVHLENLLQQFDTEHSNEAMRYLDGFVHMIKEHSMRFAEHLGDLDANLSSVHRSLAQFDHSMTDVQNLLRQTVIQRETELLAQNENFWQHEMRLETNEHVLNRQLISNSECYDILTSRCRSLSDWRWPGLVFRPAQQELIKDLVALDPLYLVDHNLELLEPCVAQFHPVYQRRLRCYAVNDWQNGTILHHFPDNQFGFVLAYNYFNFKPLKLIQQYLDELITKLRPGGTLIMTYNNCDWAHNVALAEKNFMCYTPGRLIVAHAQNIGFEIAEQHHDHADLHWISLRRPGKLTSIRAAQVLAKIVAYQ